MLAQQLVGRVVFRGPITRTRPCSSSGGPAELQSAAATTRHALMGLVDLATGSDPLSPLTLVAALDPALRALAEYHTISGQALEAALEGVRFAHLLRDHFAAAAHRQAAELEKLLAALKYRSALVEHTQALEVAALVLLAEFESHLSDLRRVLGR